MIDPTITGCFKKPLKKTPHAPNIRAARNLIRPHNGAFAMLLLKPVLLVSSNCLIRSLQCHIQTSSRLPGVGRGLEEHMDLHHSGCIAVIFCAQRTQADDEAYSAAAEVMSNLAAQQSGYLGQDSSRSPDGLGITVSYWENDEAAKA